MTILWAVSVDHKMLRDTGKGVPQRSKDRLIERTSSWRTLLVPMRLCQRGSLARKGDITRPSTDLAFCPPDKLTPLAPISVASPSSSISKSGFKAQASMTCWYRTSSYEEPNKTFSLML